MSDNRHLYGAVLKAALPPLGAEEKRPPSRSLRESVQRLDEEATKLVAEVTATHPFHLTLAELAERLR